MFSRNQPPAISLKSPMAIAAMRESGRLVAEAFELMRGIIQPGIRLADIDEAVTAFLKDRDAQPLYKGYRGNPPSHPPFPGVICASVNHEVCHGLPDKRRLNAGDLVGIDIGLKYNDYCGDACVTFPVGEVSPEAQHLLTVTQDCLAKGIQAAQPGRHLTDIGAMIQLHAEANGCSVVREWGGHGIGRNLHEPPHVSHIGPGGRGPKLRPGMVFTIEPMINLGQPEWDLLADGWTVVTRDGKLSAQFEHTVVVTENGPEILTTL
ncbi:MAG TPA: type I methionyl aminopeptidase [Anaerolineales bacterium]|nr:type I methionyl aminopeptidase [Anaerolineales bacterium]